MPVTWLIADSSVTQTGVPWIVRDHPTVDEAHALFTDIHADHRNAVIPDGRAGRETARDLRVAATDNGCFIEELVETNPLLTNSARLGRQILANHPDAILLWVDPPRRESSRKPLRNAGFTGTLAGPGRLRSAGFSAAAGNAEERLMVASPVLEPDAVTADELLRLLPQPVRP